MVLYYGWLRIKQNDGPKSWAFAFELPHTTTKSTINISKGVAEAGFAPGNHPLPPSYSCKHRLGGKVFEGFVEYWLEAILEEKTRVVEARLPLWIYPRPSPVAISDFQLRSIRSMVRSGGQVLETCSGAPYELYVERPSILQFGAAIPLWIRIVPGSNKARHIEAFLIRAEFSIRTITYIFCPIFDDRPDLTRRSKEQSWHWRDDEATLRGAPGAIVVPTGPHDEPIDVGDALGLKPITWGKLEGVAMPSPRRSIAVKGVVPEFATSFLKTKNALC